jgi:hypothetical protein
MNHEQTIWLAPRATAFTEVCAACEEEDPQLYRDLHAVVRGYLRVEDASGWATCDRGHTLRVLRMSRGMPAGALR